jgi:capsular polysaccharide transport system permease protein
MRKMLMLVCKMGWRKSYVLNLLKKRWIFVAIVGIPALLAGIYYGAVASDIYVSDVRFVVRSAQKPDVGTGIGELFKGFAATGSENVLLVRDYLLSGEAISQLERSMGLRGQYGNGDILARFPAIWQQASLEEFGDYYRKRVRLDVDANSSVGVLSVQAFDAAQAYALNKALIQIAQARIADLNAKIRYDTQEVAERELQRARDRLARADETLAKFRQQRGLLDPERQAAVELQGAQELSAKLTSAQARLNQAQRLAPQSAQVTSLEAEVKTLREAAVSLRASVTGNSAQSRVSTAQDYQALQLERELASRNLAAAHDALLRARVDVERRHLYLETVSAPSHPDSALQPKRLRNFMAALLMSLALYSVVSLLRLGAREHSQSI